MIRGALIFATGGACGVVVGAIGGVLAIGCYAQHQVIERQKARDNMAGKPDFGKAAADVADSLQKEGSE